MPSMKMLIQVNSNPNLKTNELKSKKRKKL